MKGEILDCKLLIMGTEQFLASSQKADILLKESLKRKNPIHSIPHNSKLY